MHPNAQYCIGNYFFVILFTFLLIFHGEVVVFFIFINIFFQQVLFFYCTSNLMTNTCAVFGCKAYFRTQKRKKSTKYYQISKQMIRVDEYAAFFLTKRFDWGTTTTIYLCDAIWPSPSLSQFSAWSENIYGKHHCQILHQTINHLLNNPFVKWITRNCVTCNI